MNRLNSRSTWGDRGGIVKVIAAVFALLLPFSAFAFDQNHAAWTQVLSKYQDSHGLIRYRQLKSDAAADKNHPFNTYLNAIQHVSTNEYNSWNSNQKKAFLINSYNALTVKLIVDNYPVKSIKKIGGLFTKPWNVKFFSLLDGQITSLDPIEHQWLRPKFKDYRVHAAVNCASYSCPPLRHEAFVADKLDAQLDGQMRAWLGDRTRNQLDSGQGVYKLSKIFDWYGKDFEQWGGGPVNVINKFLKKPLSRETASQIKVEYLDYNWDLNEAK